MFGGKETDPTETDSGGKHTNVASWYKHSHKAEYIEEKNRCIQNWETVVSR